MKLSYNWLKEYLAFDIEPEQLAGILTDFGLEIEGHSLWQSVKGGLEGLVVGHVLECERHPNADKLSVTKVDVGTGEPLSVVCGAPNVAKGQKVVVAVVGTTLCQNDEEFQIKKAKIRGELSEGMICAEDEIGLGDSHEGIIVLPPETPVGMSAKDYFGVTEDHVFEIGITPNRIDGASHLGVARDLAAWLNLKTPTRYTRPDVSVFQTADNPPEIPVIIENPEACSRYSGLTIRGVTVKESPQWLKDRLMAIGQKPINNVVDVTNYVLHECGQPLHAFDAARISGKKVIVKTMPEGSAFVTLDGNERKLGAHDLMICNQSEGMCIAGVFGGIKSGVSSQTTDVFLESACFDPVYIRKTAKKHLLNTEASFHFERGADPEITTWALRRAALLIQQVAGGQFNSRLVDEYPAPVARAQVILKKEKLRTVVGQDIPHDDVNKILQSLEILIISENSEAWNLEIPLYRVDVKYDVDVIEEVMRIYGFNRILTGEKVSSTLAYLPRPDNGLLTNRVADMLSANGMNEIMTTSLTKAAHYEGLASYPPESLVNLLNPISSELGVMRQTLLFGALETISLNISHKNRDLRLYEFGNCYAFSASGEASAHGRSCLKGYTEETHLSIALSGNRLPINWKQTASPSDFFALKATVERIFSELNLDPGNLETDDSDSDLFDYGISYLQGGVTLARIGKVSNSLQKRLDIDQPVFFGEMYWERLLAALPGIARFAALPKFHPVSRDLSMILNREVTFGQLRAIALRTEKKLLRRVTIFDVYEGKGIDPGKKSYALNFVLQDDEKTLTDQQIDKAMEKIALALEREAGAKIRS